MNVQDILPTGNDQFHYTFHGCETHSYWNEASNQSTWECNRSIGEVGLSNLPLDPRYCGPGYEEIIFSKGHERPMFQIPPGFGFRIGSGSRVNYLVVNMHYHNLSDAAWGNNWQGNSGVRVFTRASRPNKRIKPIHSFVADVTSGHVPGRAISRIEAACEVDNEAGAMHPIAIWTHTHLQTRAINIWKVDRRTGDWDYMGSKFPNQYGTGSREEKLVYYLHTRPEMVFLKGDSLAFECTVNITMKEERNFG